MILVIQRLIVTNCLAYNWRTGGCEPVPELADERLDGGP